MPGIVIGERGFLHVKVITANADDPTFSESPEDLRIHAPVPKRFANWEEIIEAAAGFEATIHCFGLPFHKGKTAFGPRALPFVKKIGAVNLGVGIGAGFVHSECARGTEENGLGIARVKRIFETRDVNEIVERASFAIDGHAPVKHAVLAGVAERVASSAAAILHGEDEL